MQTTQDTLPPESIRTLRHINGEADATVTHLEFEFGVSITSERRERLIDIGLRIEPERTALALCAVVAICPN